MDIQTWNSDLRFEWEERNMEVSGQEKISLQRRQRRLPASRRETRRSHARKRPSVVSAAADGLTESLPGERETRTSKEQLEDTGWKRGWRWPRGSGTDGLLPVREGADG